MKVDSAAWLNDVANVGPSSQTLPLDAQDQHEDSRQVDVANGYQGLDARLAVQQVEQSLRSYAAASLLDDNHFTVAFGMYISHVASFAATKTDML